MGTNYFAVDKTKTKAFELGKDDWGLNDKTFSKVADLATHLHWYAMSPRNDFFFSPTIQTKEYALWMAFELWKIGSEYTIVSDHSDGAPYQNCKIRGTRFTGDGNNVGEPLTNFLEPYQVSVDDLIMEDAKHFGIKTIIYCKQHLRPHTTNWCTVSNDEKIKLNATTLEDAYVECREKGYKIFSS